ncbi:MAG: transcription-repair coupling factor, partial [Sulfuricella sp.]|nr:transcription-repair coupling factor [Sulfuricella sp.]
MRGFNCHSMLLGQPLPAPGSRKRYASLQGSSDALALAQLARQKRPLLILTETAADAQRLHDEIPYFAPALSVHLLPDWETLPYDQFSPHQDLISERLATLYQISQNACDIAIIPATTALYRLPPREFLAAHTFFLKQGTQLDLDALRGQLTLAGYTHVTQVLSPGEYSVRGGIVDLFPMGSPLPYRIDLFDNEIESIRTFDADTQRSIYPVKDVRLLPAREFPLDKAGQDTFRRNFREKFEGDPSKSRLYKDVSAGLAPHGIEYYLPLFFENTATLFDYLPQDALICQYHGLETAAQNFWRDTQSRYQLLRGDRDRPLLPPQELFLTVEALFGALKPYPRIELSTDTQDSALNTQHSTLPLPSVQVDRRADNPVSRLQQFVAGFDGRILLLAESLGRRETMLQYLMEHGLRPVPCETYADFLGSREKFMLGTGPLSTGFIIAPSPCQGEGWDG